MKEITKRLMQVFYIILALAFIGFNGLVFLALDDIRTKQLPKQVYLSDLLEEIPKEQSGEQVDLSHLITEIPNDEPQPPKQPAEDLFKKAKISELKSLINRIIWDDNYRWYKPPTYGLFFLIFATTITLQYIVIGKINPLIFFNNQAKAIFKRYSQVNAGILILIIINIILIYY